MSSRVSRFRPPFDVVLQWQARQLSLRKRWTSFVKSTSSERVSGATGRGPWEAACALVPAPRHPNKKVAVSRKEVRMADYLGAGSGAFTMKANGVEYTEVVTSFPRNFPLVCAMKYTE